MLIALKRPQLCCKTDVMIEVRYLAATTARVLQRFTSTYSYHDPRDMPDLAYKVTRNVQPRLRGGESKRVLSMCKTYAYENVCGAHEVRAYDATRNNNTKDTVHTKDGHGVVRLSRRRTLTEALHELLA